MLDDKFPLCAQRISVVLCNVRLARRRNARLLTRQAAVEALDLLGNLDLLGKAGAGWEIWSHAFRFAGSGFLLSTHLQVARDVDHRANGRPATIERLAARLVIEVAPAPEGLTPRTLLHRHEPARGKGRRQWADVRELAA